MLINSVPSPWRAFSSGVPLGSVMGQVLANLFINDLDQRFPISLAEFGPLYPVAGQWCYWDSTVALGKGLF